jgi:ribulose-5-phosphate 4-epimerase/fuculose-1-phosphate aldolase
MTEDQAREELVDAGRRLLALGLVARSWGNLSLRLGPKTMAITPSGIPYPDLTEEMIVVVDLETGDWSGNWKPSGERKIHREVYRLRPEVRAIVHTHQNAASACASARASVPAPWGQVPCAAYGLPGTKALTQAAVRALGDTPAVLLANHGVFAVGAGLSEAFARIQALETACADLIAEKARGPLPARVDAPWDRSWLQSLPLADGYPALLSSAPFTKAWALRGEPLKASLDDLAQLVGPSVPAAPRVADHRPKNDALFVKDRGLIVSGDDAEALAMVVEKAARAFLGGEALGGAAAIPACEAHLMRWVYKNSYAKRAAAASRPKNASEG